LGEVERAVLEVVVNGDAKNLLERTEVLQFEAFVQLLLQEVDVVNASDEE
jgi:hypothetical protein